MTRPSGSSSLSDVLRRLDTPAGATSPDDAIPTGFPSIDRMLGGGFRRGDLIILGGDVGSGKSALALAIALRIAAGRDVTFLSAEMSVERVLERALAIEGRVRVDDLRRGQLDEAARAGVAAAGLQLRDATLTVSTLPGGGVQAVTDELQRALDVELGVLDPLQALSAGVLSHDEELAAAMLKLKRAATELGVALLVTAHTPKLSRARPDPRPTLEDYGALGAVGQHADVVLGIYREEMYQPSQGVEGATELLVSKNRNGPTGYVDLYFYKQWLRFEDMLDPDR